LPVPTSGAQRASLRRPLVSAVLGALMAVFLIAPVASAYTPPWEAEEFYYLRLVNCTRTGGWVLKDGSCTGYGSGRYSAYVPPLKHSPSISNRVSRPYARLLAVNAKCSHFLDGDPGYRLRRAGFNPSTWGENIGCRDGYATVKAAILASHLVFQNEKWTNGGHWRNIKNARFQYIGIGIWRYNGRTRLVTDFYRPA
jgi:hypothetical protein